MKELFSPVWDEVKSVWTKDIFRDVFKTPPSELSSPEDYINQSLYFEAKTFLHGLLVVEDKLSMAHSLETRVPFLDNDLVDFAMQCPVRFKVKFGKDTNRPDENRVDQKYIYKSESNMSNKLILRKSLQNYLGLESRTRPKQGFSAPDASWFRTKSWDYTQNKLNNKDSKLFLIFSQKKIKSFLEDHYAGHKNRRLILWSLLSIDENMNQYNFKL